MSSGWRYRVTSVGGTLLLTALSVAVANHPAVKRLVGFVPVVGTLPKTVLVGNDFLLAVATTLAVMCVAVAPLFKPQPRRVLDTILLAQKRVLLGMLALAAIGYFDYTYRLPRLTLLVAGGVLFVAMPGLFLTVGRRPRERSRAIVVGDDPEKMAAVLDATDLPVLGYVSPGGDVPRTYPDGGVRQVETPELPAELDHLGGIARLQDVLVEHDVDTALLAFGRPDREEFFGTLDVCDRHGVTAMAHRDHADTVLTTGFDGSELATIDLDPLDLQERLAKRLFDIGFASAALLVLSPLLAVIAVAIKLDSPGPVLYSQERTAEFGETFRIYKFRSMVEDAETDTGATLSAEDADGVDPRVTRVGRVLRKTHLDEVPQLWSILKGDMSVVGPRPERPELDADIETGVEQWRRRWFVKPGLTGLAQIRGVTSYEPEQKLTYDIEYVRNQSFWFDLKIVVRQLWLVGVDVVEFLR